MKRRSFIKSTGAASLAVATGIGSLAASNLYGCSEKPFNKRDAVLDVINGTGKQNYYPGGFFMHFRKDQLFGEAAINAHLDYFKATNSDFLKVQYELKFPVVEAIQKPSDWSKVPFLKKDFYADQLKVIEGVIKKGKKDALVLATVYSPLSLAGHVTAYKHHINNLNEDPELVKEGLEIITESILIYVKECKKLGVDGFLHATQGGEFNRFQNPSIFTDYIKPLDLAIGKEIEGNTSCNILHIHNAEGYYKDYSEFVDYPAHIINTNPQLEDKFLSQKEIASIFNKPILGGMDNNGIIVKGSKEDITAEVNKVISEAPEKYILGATCTIPRGTEWKQIRAAVDAAHNFS